MEELNQVQEENVFSDDTTEENLFDDYSEDTTEDNQETEAEETQEEPWGLKVKFNDEERTLNEEEARTYAQKGMNYDRFYEPLQSLAKRNGLNSVGEYINMLNDTQTNYEVSQEVDRMKEDSKYEGVDDEILEEIARSRVATNYERQADEAKKGQDEALQAEMKRQVDVFKSEYPDIEPDKLDSQVYEYIKQGYSLLEAYNKWERINRPSMEAKAKIAQKNEENKKRSLGNTTNAGSADQDDFLKGFLNG